MIVDLISPWCAAAESADPAAAGDAFRARHAQLLESLRSARTPLLDRIPFATDASVLRPIAHRAADPAVQQRLRDLLVHAAGLGADRCRDVVLVPADGVIDVAEPIPWPDANVVVLLDRIEDDDMLNVAVARAVAAVTRWTATDSRTLVTRDSHRAWDRWQSARDVPLREWIYTEGIGLHLAQTLLPALPAHRLLGVTQVALGRLRQREKVFRALLAADLDQRGIGLVLRWLVPGAPAGPRTIGDMALPPMTGRYLAWRMLEERVARVGLREAIRMEA